MVYPVRNCVKKRVSPYVPWEESEPGALGAVPSMSSKSSLLSQELETTRLPYERTVP